MVISASQNRPNIILIVADDLGYNDLSAYGSPTISTPNIDRLGLKGVKFTQFYQGAPLCTPARSSMLTGRLPIRSGIYSDLGAPMDELFRVFYPTSEGCLPDSEVTIAEALKPEYSTMLVGKWHLGHNPNRNCLPGDGNQGFDFYYGIPYSHEEGYPGPFPESIVFPPVPLMSSGYKFVEQPFNGSDLTSRYTSLVVDLIDGFGSNAESVNGNYDNTKANTGLDYTKPFFLHIAYENPHVPIFISDDYISQGFSSRRGLYGESVEEMDRSIGAIVSALEQNDILDNTIIIFTSDNGAWINPNNGLNSDTSGNINIFDGGSNAPFYGGKGSTWEGGFRVPLLISGRDIVSSQVLQTPVTGMDLFPTILSFAQIPLPTGLQLDGIDIRGLLVGKPDSVDPHECIYFWREHTLYAIRCGQYKAHFITRSGFGFSDVGTEHDPPLLFNVEWNPSESIPITVNNMDPQQYAAILAHLQREAELHIKSIDSDKLPSEYLSQSLDVAPCCPRGHNKGDGYVSSSSSSGGNANVSAIEKSTRLSWWLDAVKIQDMLERDLYPWESCICPRIL